MHTLLALTWMGLGVLWVCAVLYLLYTIWGERE